MVLISTWGGAVFTGPLPSQIHRIGHILDNGITLLRNRTGTHLERKTAEVYAVCMIRSVSLGLKLNLRNSLTDPLTPQGNIRPY